jgi:hypothetical protein
MVDLVHGRVELVTAVRGGGRFVADLLTDAEEFG